MRLDLLCQSCGEAEATYLRYYLRYYPEIQKPSFVDPSIICSVCQRAISQNNHYDTRQAVFYSFQDIADMPDQARGYLSSPKGKDFNALNSKFWKKKIFRIAYSEGGKNKVKLD